jgi:hypothetical protein
LMNSGFATSADKSDEVLCMYNGLLPIGGDERWNP